MTHALANSEAAIFGRLLDVQSEHLTPDLARHILALNFTTQDRARIHELIVKNQQGQLTPDEQAELDNYNHVGDLLSLWHSKARVAMKKPANHS